ncbi:N-acetyl-gamma-glutamyl-phosphate reductase [Galbibacter pacificus]|uniref:N-acetyl-gamma-glutamyl-phosphate reductase n=1 Tax=Galbibacter pacificus TaxID=2996052 RepID=A0ABT6FQ25_9FLAO|nr:N-acetyl-gamma-glutamyl-phosphate reductase [Galbibacter pacificus]MDG3582168.1 N-acetyl-gamma-glutamyl-phosphate reductase [Galbibacter pacificus]MDG3585356.1 N-acetyl-gamma-glutamyl-phosphate reductase [Galbibacter pacificus]
MIKAGIIGGSGYTGGELIRILINHPHAGIDFVYSTTRAGKPIAETHEDLVGSCSLKFTDTINPEVDVLFLCLGHGNSIAFLDEYSFSAKTKVIDLSNDFRLDKDSNYKKREFVYGLPELQKEKIKNAQNIANPGCFATAIQLALLPLAKKGLLAANIHINAITGSTGAGVSPSATSHFSWRNNNISWYKPFTHQHLGEINQSIVSLQNNQPNIFMLPQRGNFTKGIFVTSYMKFENSLEETWNLYKDFYVKDPFTHLSTKEVHLKQVINTNNCFIHLHKHEDVLLITSVIDNLIKGASGQAVQNMNLLFGFDECDGLKLKGSYF